MDFQLDEVKIMKCKECGVDVPVNINYPINRLLVLGVGLRRSPMKNDRNF